jgi:hypothetical protein
LWKSCGIGSCTKKENKDKHKKMKFSLQVIGTLPTILVFGLLLPVSGTKADPSINNNDNNKEHLAQRQREDFTFWRDLQEDLSSFPTPSTGTYSVLWKNRLGPTIVTRTFCLVIDGARSVCVYVCACLCRRNREKTSLAVFMVFAFHYSSFFPLSVSNLFFS